jgi:nucleoside phosphorylase
MIDWSIYLSPTKWHQSFFPSFCGAANFLVLHDLTFNGILITKCHMEYLSTLGTSQSCLSMTTRIWSYSDYTVGWICALPVEITAATAMLDEVHGKLPALNNDPNIYTLGRIEKHNVVIVCLPSGVCGTTSATAAITWMKSTFREIRFGFMVGVGGGAPTRAVDIRLGDVVVSRPSGASSGVMQYDYGKTIGDGQFHHTSTLNKPPQILLNAISHLEANYQMGQKQMLKILFKTSTENSEMRSFFSSPGVEQDSLFKATYNHVENEETCEKCDASELENRKPRLSDEPQIHYGIIASANQVMRHGATRDRLAQKFGILCFEMEAAGLMDQLPCLVVRGICDYADTHKNKAWQMYAAATAAAYTKELLFVIPTPMMIQAKGNNESLFSILDPQRGSQGSQKQCQ